MTTVVSVEEMRWCEARTMSRFGVPGLLLMDRAGSGAARRILDRFALPAGSTVDVVCGKGNNAGDGFVVARLLARNNLAVRVLLTSPADQLRGDAAAQFRMTRAEAGATSSGLRILSFSAIVKRPSGVPALIIDALFGTGFTGEPRAEMARGIEWMNAPGVPIAALDIPSGLDATTGIAAKRCVRASLTVTFGLKKTGLLVGDGPDTSGQVETVDIGLPAAVCRDPRLKTFEFSAGDATRALSLRPRRLHKYSAGKVLVIAGSSGYSGAAVLCGTGALRSGAGAVVMALA